jgi:aromatic-L-amino-acid/L-tryptophan decarboxylase
MIAPTAPEDPASLEIDEDEMRRLARLTVDKLLEHLRGVARAPAAGLGADEAYCRALVESAPEAGQALEPLLDAYLNDWVPRTLTTNGPGYMAYVPGGGLFSAALADMVSDLTNRFTGARFASPPLVELEANTLRWFCDWMGMPDGARGIYTSGGSMANFNAVLCARERGLGADIRGGVLYTSTQAHHSVAKAARLAGVMPDRVRALPVDARFRFDVRALPAAIAQDRARGLRPFMIVTSAGTTNTGAVDPLDAVADVAAREGLWHHVDGAYGAFFHACPELRPLLAGLPRADSITLDPHKGLFLPYGTGALLVRDGGALREVHGAGADYMPDQSAGDVYDPCQMSPELSRGYPGLRVWLTFKLFGAARLRAALAEKRALAVRASERLAADPHVVMVAPPELSLLAFYVTRPGATRETEDAATREVLARVEARGRVHLSGCHAAGRQLARVCILSFRSRREHVDACVEDVLAAVGEVLGS